MEIENWESNEVRIKERRRNEEKDMVPIEKRRDCVLECYLNLSMWSAC